MMIRMVGGWVFLMVLAHPGSPGQRAVKRLLCCVWWQWCFLASKKQTIQFSVFYFHFMGFSGLGRVSRSSRDPIAGGWDVAGMVCGGKLLQLAEGTRHCDPLLPARRTSGPAVCVRVHSAGTRVRSSWRARQGAGGVPQCTEARRATLQCLVWFNARLLFPHRHFLFLWPVKYYLLLLPLYRLFSPLVSVSKGLQAVKLSFNKILQFLTGKVKNTPWWALVGCSSSLVRPVTKSSSS